MLSRTFADARAMLAASAAMLAAIVLTFATLISAHAQELPDPLQPGDIAWAFANEDPLFDQRVAGAIGTAMQPHIEANTPVALTDAGARIVRVEANGPALEPATTYPASDVTPLLQAAGFGATPPFVELAACRIWTASADVDPYGPILVQAAQAAFAQLDVEVQPCVATTNPAEAHILVWLHGQDTAPTLDMSTTPTWISGVAPPPPPTGGAGSGTGGSPTDGPPPASTGNYGSSTETPRGLTLLATLGAAILLLPTARRLTRRG